MFRGIVSSIFTFAYCEILILCFWENSYLFRLYKQDPQEPSTTLALVQAPPTSIATQNTLQPGVHGRQHRRQSSINTVSWTDQGDNSSGRANKIQNNLDPSDVRYNFIHFY